MNVQSCKLTLLASSFLVLAACSGGGGGSDGSSGGGGPSGVVLDTEVNTAAKATVLLNRATFGGSERDMNAVMNRDAADWLAAEFAKSPTFYRPATLRQIDTNGELESNANNYLTWDTMISANDQLRQRMVFALSQIIVKSVSSTRGTQQLRHAYFQDVLTEHAFGNYRTLLEEVTYAPAMAEWLTYLRNRKGNPNTGRMPDENYAREILQLFSIGLIELNPDGTERLDAQGQPIEIFDNDDIVGLAKVFTGLSYKGSSFRDEDDDAFYSRLQMFDEEHSELEKSFLGLTIPPNTSGEDSIRMALDHIFDHPNVGPFVSRQLIQRFTASNPEPAYIQRVSSAFDSGSFTAPNGRQFGTGQRGDLEATLAAVLLDPTLYDDVTSPADGKVREPILRFTHWARAFDVSGIDSSNHRVLRDTRDPGSGLGQHPFMSPSVFNFYRPGYVAPGTETGDRNLTAPEFQLVNESTALGYLNFMTDFALDRTNRADDTRATFVPDYSDELALAFDGPALIDHLDDKLTAGRLTDQEKTDIAEILATMRSRTDTPENEDEDRLERTQVAVVMVMNSPSFAIIY